MYQEIIKTKKAFTLVELIITITILVILTTIGFISFQGYTKDARDGNRVATLKNIETGLGIYYTTSFKYPKPDILKGQTKLQTGALSISGTTVEYSYLGEIGENLSKELQISNKPKDPLTSDNYLYSTTLKGKTYQIASILENTVSYRENLITKTYAGNNYIAKVEGNHKIEVIHKIDGKGKFITIVPSLIFDVKGSNILNNTGTLSIVNNKSNLPYGKNNNIQTSEKLIKELRGNDLATTVTLQLPEGITLDGSGVLNEWWAKNKNSTNWNKYSTGVILASLGAIDGVTGGANYEKLTSILNGGDSGNVIEKPSYNQEPEVPVSYDVGNSLRMGGKYFSYRPKQTTDSKIWTFSFWMKRTNLSGGYPQRILSAGAGTSNKETEILLDGNDRLSILLYNGESGSYPIKRTKMQLRDVSSWYHIVGSMNISDSTPNNRMKLWVNGVLVTDFQENVAPYNQNTSFNTSTIDMYIGRYFNSSIANDYFYGYLSDINFIDGQALEPTSFGQFDTNGRWIPKSYTGSYGTNGFHLDFSSGASLTTLGLDSAPIEGNHTQANNWTLSPTFNTYDQMLDSPTNNFATLNPIHQVSTTSPASGPGNLSFITSTSGYNSFPGSIPISKGKWMWSVVVTGGTELSVGVVPDNWSNVNSSFITSGSYGYGYYTDTLGRQAKIYNGVGSGNGTYGKVLANGDIIDVLLDMDNGTIGFRHNNNDYGIAYSSLTGSYIPIISDGSSANNVSGYINFGQGGQTGLQYCSEAGGYFKYCPPTGFKALSTKNLPKYDIENPKQYFDVLTYTGNGSTQTLTGLSFKPDLVWIKNRKSSANHRIYDSVRGAGYQLYSDSTSKQNYSSVGLSSFNNDGFSLPNPTSDIAENASLNNYVAWNWKKSQNSGFDIVKGKKDSTINSQSFSHNLGKVPDFIVVKDLDNTSNWVVWHKSYGSLSGNTQITLLNQTNGVMASGNYFGNINSNIFSVAGGSVAANANFISYLWSEVPGFSKFGSYAGNNTTDGPFIYTGFKPKYLMIKNSTTGGANSYDWVIYDGARNQYNPVTNTLWADLSVTENNSSYSPKNGPNGNGDIDFLSNGFKIRSSASSMGGNSTYIYAAFAELPFK